MTNATNKTIFKYELPRPGEKGIIELELPVLAEPLSVGIQADGKAVLWARVDSENTETETIILYAINTGQQFEDEEVFFLGTITAPGDPLNYPNGIVWHVFWRLHD